MSPNPRLLLLEQVLMICASWHASALDTFLAAPEADFSAIGLRQIVHSASESSYRGTSQRPFTESINCVPSPAIFSGHGSSEQAMPPNPRLLLLEQRRYGLLGLPTTSAGQYQFPARHAVTALRAFLAFADVADLRSLYRADQPSLLRRDR
ncbi:hypothetical protein HPB50_014828 [Hyalomma asiaticum]|uniref:Uncharacterized protein n=1 Tax=Hyalomma asiaticum TaxID=266040 RepID=A0ACB7TGS5_HYAAI|nr:hypothetical protein HPB50_014828 [Hyalomma asiaticum]